MLGENQPVDPFYFEVTPKPLKKVKKLEMDLSEEEENPPPTPSVADQTPPPQPEVRDMEKWHELATSHHEQLRLAAAKLGKLQLTTLELEAHVVRLETTLAAWTKVKEMKETLFPKYLATLRSKIEDVTRIAELEAHMEGLGLDIPEKITPSPAEALRTQLLAQMEGLARILLGEEGPMTSFKWTHGAREELLAPVAIPDSLEVEIGGSSSS
ncbi:hypothetical protein R1sor_023320 [Riccia sorocarpa]|uniref:Uncharacterized protein n=1 Tax=Riccia sorocarpa TaxID=122646 RepID=A0ABD3GRH7_9MARC